MQKRNQEKLLGSIVYCLMNDANSGYTTERNPHALNFFNRFNLWLAQIQVFSHYIFPKRTK